MTALAGLLRLDGVAAAPDALAPVLQAQAARGPDGQRQFADGPVVLAERVLHPRALPVAHLPQPLQAVARLGPLTLIWDGRLDNREELLAALGGAGVELPAELACDDRFVLLHLWREFGEDVLPRLLGDFAFALWDAQRRELLLARDAMGARPLYYTAQPAFFALASEDEALLALPGVSPAPNMERVAYALCPAFLDFDWSVSWLAEVRILMPGTSLRVRADGRTDRRTWWAWPLPEPARFARDEEALEAFDAVMTQATRDRTRDLDTIGLITSGGMDTATVAVAAQAVRAGRPLQLFATLQDDPAQCIESRAIEALARTLEADLVGQRVPSMRGPVSAADVRDFYARPHPVDGSISVIGMMCLAARRRDQRVLLHGVSGDLAFYAPDDSLLRTLWHSGLRSAWHEARAAQQHHTYVQGRSPLVQGLRAIYADLAPPRVKAAWRALRRSQRGAAYNALREAGALGRRLRLPERVRAASLREDLEAWPRPRLPRERRQAMFPIGLLRGLEGYERVAGRYGVALRDPLADRRVIAFCLALPQHWLTRDGWTKYIARRWASRVLPEVCVWRSDKIHLGHLLGFPVRRGDEGREALSACAALVGAAAEVRAVLADVRAYPGFAASDDALAVEDAAQGLLAWLDHLARIGSASTEVAP